MRIPLRVQLHPHDIEKQRRARAARDRHRERQAGRRRALRFVGTRRLWIMALLIGVAVFGVLLPLRYFATRKPAPPPLSKEARAVQDLWVLRTALECYRQDCRDYPGAVVGLKALVRPFDAVGWKGPYIDMLKPDPWRTPYAYGVSNGVVWLASAGPDAREGTPDDIQAPPPDRTIPRLRDLALTNQAPSATPERFDIQLVK